MKEECLICKAPLEYLETDELMECAICHKKENSKTRCIQGHYVCNECHTAGMDSIIGLCLSEISKDPVEIIEKMMALPFCHMHGPEHHVMVGAALLTAYKNAGGTIDLKTALTEKGVSRYTVFYIHGGAYRYDFIPFHWQFIEKLVKETNALVIAPAYRLAPFATYKEAFDLIVPIYKDYCEKHPEKKIMMMGDSAGGGLSLALTEYLKTAGIRLPDELVLFSPWVDVSMENEEIKEYQSRDPFLFSDSLVPAGKHWAADLDVHDPRISPIYGKLQGIHNVTVFVGTDEIIYPDATKMFHMLDQDVSNELIVGEGMNHVYPLYPIEEAKSACNKVFHVVMR